MKTRGSSDYIESMTSLNRFVKVLYDFEPSLPDEMQAKEGELLLARPAEGEEWLICLKLKENESGLVPSSFVEDIQNATEGVYRVLFAYEARDENELSVEEGDMVHALYIGEEWLLAKRADNALGLVPKNYCQNVEEGTEVTHPDAPIAIEDDEFIDIEEDAEPKESVSIPTAPTMPILEIPSLPMPSVNVSLSRSPSVSVTSEKASVHAETTDPISKKIQDSKERLAVLKEYQKSEKSAADVVKATPLPKTEGFKLPQVQLKKPSESVEIKTPKVRGPTLVEASSPERREERPLTLAKPKAAAANPSRLWTDASESFKVEASYEKLEDGNVHMKKANGSRIVVPLSKLSQGDLEYVHLQEGLPMPEPAIKKSTVVNGFDWLKFVLEAGVPPTRSLKYAEKLAAEGLDERMVSSLSRSWMERQDFETVDIVLLEKAVKELTNAINGNTLEDRMMKALEAINLKVDQVSSSANTKSEQGALVAFQQPTQKKESRQRERVMVEDDDDLPPEVTKFLSKVSHQRPPEGGVTVERRVYKYHEESVAQPQPPVHAQPQPNYYQPQQPYAPYPQQQQQMLMVPPPPPPQVPMMMVPGGYSYAPPPPPQIPQPQMVAYYHQPPPPPPQPTYYAAPPQPAYYPPPPPPQPYYNSYYPPRPY